MSFNPDSTKPAHEVAFSRKKNIHYPPILFNEHISSTLSIVNKLTAVLRKLQTVLPRHSLLSIYWAFIRPYLDYCHVIYDKIFNESWHKQLESAQYNAALAITEAI